MQREGAIFPAFILVTAGSYGPDTNYKNYYSGKKEINSNRNDISRNDAAGDINLVSGQTEGPVFDKGGPEDIAGSRAVNTGGRFLISGKELFKHNSMAGAGAYFQTQSRALLQRQVAMLRDGRRIEDAVYSIKAAATDSQYVRPSLIMARLELGYTVKKIRAGAALWVAPGGLSAGSARLLNGAVFIRWRIK